MVHHTKEGDGPAAQVHKKSTPAFKKKFWQYTPVRVVAVFMAFSLCGLVVYVGYLYASSPAAIRKPVLDHYHFRMQVLVDGQPVHFSDDQYQTSYNQSCSAELPPQPVHFHDRKDQLAHIHWAGITGGMVLKYYGWDYTGGPSDVLGYRFDDLPKLRRVPIHGNVLPKVPEGATLHVYSGDETFFRHHDTEEFLEKDLEKFFGKESSFPSSAAAGWLGALFPKAAAHAGHVHEEEQGAGEETEKERLSRINNLIGNVVIFAQKSQPTNEQIQTRFANLEALSDSVCGG